LPNPTNNPININSMSEMISRVFYDAFGADRLSARVQPELTAAVVSKLIEKLPAQGKVLDLGCGFGRIALPLAERGLNVSGIDVSPVLIEAGRCYASDQGLDIDFTVGSMTQLPYPDNEFHDVICVWSSFNELLERDEQVATLKEILRVMRPDALSIIEGFSLPICF